MFQVTRRRLALWYTAVTAVLLLLFASGFYLYVRTTLVERVDDTLKHVVEIVERSLVIERAGGEERVFDAVGAHGPPLKVNVEASFRDNASAVEDDHIDLEWFSPTGQLLWSTLSAPLGTPLAVNPAGATVRIHQEQVLRQITERVQADHQVLGYLRVSHPWFEVTKPSRRLIQDLALGTSLMVGVVAAIGWLLSGIAMAPVRESYQQLKQFTADASHELRNPIAVIQTNVQVALSDPEPDLATQQQQLQVIERLTRRLGRLVDDLLFLARQESGLVPLKRAQVNLDRLLAELVEEQQVLAADKGIQLIYGLSVEPLVSPRLPTGGSRIPVPGELNDSEAWLTVVGDADQLTRLFTNLIGNALQYTPAGGKINLVAKPIKLQGQAWVQVQVIDTGIGIAPEALAHVFDRFYRADPARNRGQDGAAGTGLGLAIARVITDNHRGTIGIDSQLGAGTTLTVQIPRGSVIPTTPEGLPEAGRTN